MKRDLQSSSFVSLFEESAAPLYVVDERRQIVFANGALAEWVAKPIESIVGSVVAYHSEPSADPANATLTGLCPNPTALAGAEGRGVVSTMDLSGRLRRRRARFIPLSRSDGASSPVLVICDPQDIPAEELARTVLAESTADDLHRQIRAFRRRQSEPLADALLLGSSPAARKLRVQCDLAARSRTSATIIAATESESLAIARAIHYSVADPSARLTPLDASLMDDEELAATIDRLVDQSKGVATVLIQNAALASSARQRQLADCIERRSPRVRVLATIIGSNEAPLAAELDSIVGGVVVRDPHLSSRMEDLLLLTQYFIERENARQGPQRAGGSSEFNETLALHDWPGGVAELAEVIEHAHAAASGPYLTPETLPPSVRHAAIQAGISPKMVGAIALDRFLDEIERTLVTRALDLAHGNKTEAARLLGLNRPRLYRVLERLGLVEPTGDPPPTSEPIDFEEIVDE